MQENVWEKEYRDPKLVTLSREAASCIKDFARFLRKDQKLELSNLEILDLGCGNGKNSFYIADQGLGNKITGIEISETALSHAREYIPDGKFIKASIGSPFPFPDSYFDIVLDVTSSNSLFEAERDIYLKETYRVMKPGSYFFVRALCKDGDANAKKLLEMSPGKEKDTYIMPELGLTERVFTKEDFISLYSPLFELLYIDKETHYTKFKGQSYKRHFWIATFKKIRHFPSFTI